jgi:uncharacterized coiled-coil DUF342 family protein
VERDESIWTERTSLIKDRRRKKSNLKKELKALAGAIEGPMESWNHVKGQADKINRLAEMLIVIDQRLESANWLCELYEKLDKEHERITAGCEHVFNESVPQHCVRCGRLREFV